jgi:hypothetical protein
VGRAAQRRQPAGRACSGMECLWAAASAEPIAALNPRLLSGLIEILGICVSAPLFGVRFPVRGARERSIPHFEPVQPAQAVAALAGAAGSRRARARLS